MARREKSSFIAAAGASQPLDLAGSQAVEEIAFSSRLAVAAGSIRPLLERNGTLSCFLSALVIGTRRRAPGPRGMSPVKTCLLGKGIQRHVGNDLEWPGMALNGSRLDHVGIEICIISLVYAPRVLLA